MTDEPFADAELDQPLEGVTEEGWYCSVLPGRYEVIDFVADERGQSLILDVGDEWIAIDPRYLIPEESEAEARAWLEK